MDEYFGNISNKKQFKKCAYLIAKATKHIFKVGPYHIIKMLLTNHETGAFCITITYIKQKNNMQCTLHVNATHVSKLIY